MYESHSYEEKKGRVEHLSRLICKISTVPEQYLSGEDAAPVIEYLCDIEYDLIRQLDCAPRGPRPGKEGI